MTTDDDHRQEVGVIATPTEHLLQELFPIGPMTLDDKGKTELDAICRVALLQHRVLHNLANRDADHGHLSQLRAQLADEGVDIDNSDHYIKALYFHLTELPVNAFHLYTETDLAQGLVIEASGPVQLMGNDPLRSAKLMTQYLANIIISHACIRRYPQIRFPPSHYVIWALDVHRAKVTVTGYRDPFKSALNPDAGKDDF